MTTLYLFYLALCLTATGATLLAGPAGGLVFVYLPSELLFGSLPSVDLWRLPDATASFAAMYGILLGIILQMGMPMHFRWRWVDSLVIALALVRVVGALVKHEIYTGVSWFGTELLAWLAPYFVARMAFQSAVHRGRALWVVVWATGFICFIALIEFRLWPDTYRQFLHHLLGLQPEGILAYKRYGFFRARGTFVHPIYLGDAGLVLMGLIGTLAATTAVGLRHGLVRLALLAGLGCVVTSISFGPYSGLLAGVALFVLLRHWPDVRKWLPAGIMLMYVAGFAIAWNLSVSGTGFGPKAGLEGSIYIRSLILQRSWDHAAGAGLFGWPEITQEEIQLESVDNAYLLFIMNDGWIYFLGWIALAVAMGYQVSRALARCRNDGEAMPLMIAVSSLVAVLVGMFNVWASRGFLSLWAVLLACTMTLSDICLARPVMAAPQPRAAGRPVWPPMPPQQELAHDQH